MKYKATSRVNYVILTLEIYATLVHPEGLLSNMPNYKNLSQLILALPRIYLAIVKHNRIFFFFKAYFLTWETTNMCY